jgi:glycosyltransferase involved in cell wall biosynthesis
MVKKSKILFLYKWVSIYPWNIPTPALKDYNLLKNRFEVKLFSFTFLKIPILIKEIIRSNLIFIWFAHDHAFVTTLITRIIKRPVVVVIAGFEVANIKELRYGYMLNPLHKNIVKYVLKNADIILPVHESLKNDALKYTNIKGENIHVLPTGYDDEKFKPKGEKENLVISVALCPDWNRARLKGLDIFVKAAKFLPDIEFKIIGLQSEALIKLKEIAPPNVELLKPIISEKLISYYQKAKVFCQLSMREGLPNTLCEAMLCECVPVGTKIPGNQSAMGDSGFYVDYGDIKGTVDCIKTAILSKKDLGKKARKRIKDLYSEKKRKEEMEKLFLNLINKYL